tara:strand:- start:3597 stop:3803 length:207 start_codon:yes stop_codon:yes gene_type:complete
LVEEHVEEKPKLLKERVKEHVKENAKTQPNIYIFVNIQQNKKGVVEENVVNVKENVVKGVLVERVVSV